MASSAPSPATAAHPNDTIGRSRAKSRWISTVSVYKRQGEQASRDTEDRGEPSVRDRARDEHGGQAEQGREHPGGRRGERRARVREERHPDRGERDTSQAEEQCAVHLAVPPVALPVDRRGHSLRHVVEVQLRQRVLRAGEVELLTVEPVEGLRSAFGVERRVTEPLQRPGLVPVAIAVLVPHDVPDECRQQRGDVGGDGHSEISPSARAEHRDAARCGNRGHSPSFLDDALTEPAPTWCAPSTGTTPVWISFTPRRVTSWARPGGRVRGGASPRNLPSSFG